MKRRMIVGIVFVGMCALSGLAAAEPALSARQQEGRDLFHSTCIYCHGERGPGTTMLERRLGKENAFIEQRADLTGPYIKTAVRKGVNSMPWYRKTELSDIQVEAIAAYLTRSNPDEAN